MILPDNLPENNIPNTDVDVLVVGAAAAGLTAALYTSRRTLRTLIVTTTLGGQAALAEIIENYPGIERINGLELMQRMLEHAKKYGAAIAYETVRSIRKDNDIFYVQSTHTQWTARAVILAFGLTSRPLGVPGEDALQGHGVCYCATCDAPLYRGKRVAVVGGTFEALDAALLLSRLNCEVVYIHEKDAVATHPDMFAQVQHNERVEMRLNTAVVRIVGATRVEGIAVRDAAGKEETLSVEGVFVEKGHRIDASWLHDLVELNRRHAIIVNEEHETKTPGLFAAGDVTPLRDKQVVISAGDGAAAALAAYRFIQRQSHKPAVRVDWEHT